MAQFSFIGILVLVALHLQPGMKAPDSSNTSVPGPMNPWGTTGNGEGATVCNPYS
ncbi:hypothetical protein PCANC_05169 [Puccinia coronata f. sp. avenae]|uniref:Uncharacterized protein n=1 Tax=Puccinia coronata f. sp. avenae TaxID=200324 RepID=A0A2N5W369_9BASI|nr:hypothetical protein PCASD_14277 [Puccinia coronata f. sp. avenae]PLW40133.1 hypothetical protein PCASD_07853 [Puccinia coronata f. sp. avenae]PLW56665.1 hypothetical protein PCANC_05169 [Puccinia coronata f. sp. avenae]